MENPFLFALTVVTVLGTPGPTNTLLATAAASDGLKRALMLMPAEAFGYIVAISVVDLVLRPIIIVHPSIALILRLVVCLYLLWLAVKLWHKGKTRILEGVRIVTFSQVFIATLLNPKSLIFALGVIPFSAPRLWIYLISFLALLSVMAVVWISFGAIMGKVARSGDGTRLIPRIGAAVVATFALLLVAGALIPSR